MKEDDMTEDATTVPWAWDAQALALDPQSASIKAAAVGKTPGQGYWGPMAYFFAEIGRVFREANTPTYDFYTSVATEMDKPVKMPAWSRPGISNDGHLLVVDLVEDRWHDLDFGGQPKLSADGKLPGADVEGGSSMPRGSVVVPRVAGDKHQGATAAMFPLARGIVTPDQIQKKLIPHSLCIVAANLGPAPNPYPANSLVGYTSGNFGSWAGKSVTGHTPLGKFARLNRNWQISSSAPEWEQVFAAAMRDHGIALRDRGSSVSFHGADDGGGGHSIDAWQSVGVPFVKRADGSSNMTLKFQHIDWTQLEFCVAPPQS